jgi:hypothetical protein
MNSVISSMLASLEKPAAWRWPPPPLLRAIAETSRSASVVRRLIRWVGPFADERCEL